MSEAVTADAVITGLGSAVRGLDGPWQLLSALPDGHREAADPVSRLSGRGLRYKDRATKLAMVAARDALRAAALLDEAGDLTVPGESVGVSASTNYGNADTVCETVRTIAESTYLGTSPMMLPATSSNVVASWVAITHGLRGANLTLCNGPTSGLDAVNWARLLIGSGRAERMLVVGVEPDNPAVRHVTGVAQERAGGVPELFDGAAALVVESRASAEARGCGRWPSSGRTRGGAGMRTRFPRCGGVRPGLSGCGVCPSIRKGCGRLRRGWGRRRAVPCRCTT